MAEKKKVVSVRSSSKSVTTKKKPAKVVKKTVKKTKRILTAEGWKRRMMMGKL